MGPDALGPRHAAKIPNVKGDADISLTAHAPFLEWVVDLIRLVVTLATVLDTLSSRRVITGIITPVSTVAGFPVF